MNTKKLLLSSKLMKLLVLLMSSMICLMILRLISIMMHPLLTLLTLLPQILFTKGNPPTSKPNLSSLHLALTPILDLPLYVHQRGSFVSFARNWVTLPRSATRSMAIPTNKAISLLLTIHISYHLLLAQTGSWILVLPTMSAMTLENCI